MRQLNSILEEGPELDFSPKFGGSIMINGYGNDLKCLSYREGNIFIQEKKNFLVKDDGILGPFFPGTISTYYGDSGAGVWSRNGLAGINLGFIAFPDDYFYPQALEEAAHFTMHNYFVRISIYGAIEV
uniref:Uncharacterized protein n=1 Tax=Meloidogyne floridensis TaxID=298350 RepID=A0A915NIE3_9BILA